MEQSLTLKVKWSGVLTGGSESVRICFLSLSLPDYVISAGPRVKSCDQCSDSSSA